MKPIFLCPQRISGTFAEDSESFPKGRRFFCAPGNAASAKGRFPVYFLPPENIYDKIQAKI
jgi:hypothetical protein